MHLPKARNSILVQQEQDDFFLVDTDGGEVFQVNATAARIFGFCQAGGSVESAVLELAQALSISGQDAEIREDVEATVKQLTELGLCEQAESEGAS